jgi:Flp pilus assembly protein TadD
MPAKTYMVVDPRRDHSFRVPRPDLSVALGTPNACTGCHAGRSDQWAAETVARWYGPERRREPHFGSVLHAARAGAVGAAGLLVSLITDRAQPAIARATALSLLPRYAGPGSIRAYRAGLRDSDPLVRAASLRALSPFPPDQRLVAAGDLLTDPVGTVRIEAARTLAAVPPRLMSSQQKAAFARAAEAFVEAQMATAERPESHLVLGTFFSDRANFPKAEAAYREALRLEHSFVPAYVNLAELARLQGGEGEGEAEAILRDAIARQPDSAAALHALGLSLIRQGRRQAAVDPLRKASAIEPGNARFRYILGVTLNAVGETDHALTVLEQAHERHPSHRDILIALITFNRDIGALARARHFADKLVEAHPNDPLARHLHREMKRPR